MSFLAESTLIRKSTLMISTALRVPHKFQNEHITVDIQQMKKNCHLFYKDHRYGAKYIQLIEPEEYLARTNFIARNLMKTAKLHHVDTNELVGKMITRAPLLLDPKLSERSFGGGSLEENWKKNLALLKNELELSQGRW